MPTKSLTRGQRQKILEAGVVLGFARLAQMAEQMARSAGEVDWRKGDLQDSSQLLEVLVLHDQQPIVRALCQKLGHDVVRKVALEVLASGRCE